MAFQYIFNILDQPFSYFFLGKGKRLGNGVLHFVLLILNLRCMTVLMNTPLGHLISLLIYSFDIFRCYIFLKIFCNLLLIIFEEIMIFEVSFFFPYIARQSFN